MRWILLFLLLASSVFALPASPSIPTDAFPGPSATVTILYPEAVAKTSFNITYLHTGPTSGTCSVAVNNTIIVDKTRTVAPNTPQVESITRPEGTYTIRVNCSTSTWSASSTTTVNVSNAAQAGGLTITSPVYRGAKVTISGTFGGYEEVTFAIKDPAGNVTRLTDISQTNGYAKVEYTLTSRVGRYTVNATDEDEKTLNGTFNVTARLPVIKVGHNLTNITTGAAFTLHGWQFLPDDSVTIKIGTVTDTASTDSNGEFDFYYSDPLPPKSYTISAQAVGDTKLSATTTLLVVADNLPPVVKTPEPLPVITPPKTDPGSVETPKNTQPAPTPTPTTPNNEEPSEILVTSTVPWRWILIPLFFLLVIGGIVGYFIYNGTLDVSSFGALQSSIKDMVDGNLTTKQRSMPPPLLAKPSAAEEMTIKNFINGERVKGFDDLTIRSALLAKGWDKMEVDRIFDELYKN